MTNRTNVQKPDFGALADMLMHKLPVSLEMANFYKVRNILEFELGRMFCLGVEAERASHDK